MGRGLNWGVFNSWWREHLAKHGERPKAEDLKRWYTEESRRAFPSDPPTYTMIRNHAKGLRDIAAVKHYFRDYRARKRRAFADLEGLPTSKPLNTGETGAAGEGGSGSGSGDDATGNAGGASPAVRAQHPAGAQRPRRRPACGGGGGRGGGGRGRGSSCSGDTTEVDTEEEEGGEDGMSCSSDEDWSSEGGPKRRRQQPQQQGQQQQQRRRAQRQAAAALAPWSATAVEQAGLAVDTDLAFGSGGRGGAQAPWAPAEQGLTHSVARDTACGPPASPSHQLRYHQYQPDGDGGDVGLEDLPTVTVRVTGGGRGAGAVSHARKQACGDCDDAMDAAAGATVQCKREPDACGEEAGTPTKRLAMGRGTPRSSFAPFLARIHALPPASARPRATPTTAASEPPAANPSSMARGGPFAAAAAAALAGAAVQGAAPAGGAATVAGTATAAAGGHHEEGLFMGLHGVGGTPAGGAGSLGPREFTGSVSIGGGNGGGCRGSGCVMSGSLGLTVAAAEGGAPGNGAGGSSSGAGASGGGGVVSPSGGGSRGGSFTSQQQQQQQQQQVWTPFAITVPGAASVTAPVGSCYGCGTGPRQSTNTGAMGTEPAAAAAADAAAAAAAAGTGATPARDVDTAAPSSDGAPEATEAAAAAKPQAKHSVGGEAAVAATPVVTPADAPSNDSDATRLELVLGGSDEAHAAAARAATANSQPEADQGRTPAASSLLRLHHLEDGSGSGMARAASGTFATLATLPPSPALHHPPPPGGYPRADSPAGAAARRGAVPWLHHPAHHTHLLSLAAAGRAESSPLSHASPRAHLQLQLQHGGLDNSGGCDGGSGSAGVAAAMTAGSGPGSPAAWPPAHLAACGRQMSLPNLPHLGEGALPGSSHASAVASPALRVPPALHPSTQAAAVPVGPPPVTTGFAPSKNLRNAGPVSALASPAIGGGSPSSPSGGASPAALRPPPVTSLTRGVATPPPGGSGCLPDAVGVAAGAGPMQLQEDHSPSPRPGAYPDWATAGAVAAEPNPSTSNTSADGDAAAPPPQPPGWGLRPGPPFARARWYPHGHPNPHHPGGWYPYPYPYPPHLRPHHPYPGAAGSPPGAAGVAAAAASRPGGMPPYPYLGPYGPVRRRYTSAPSQPFPHLQHPQHFYATPPGAGGATAGAPGPSRLAGGARGPDGSRAAALELLAADPWMAQGYEDVRPAGMASAAAAGAGAAEGCGGASTSSADADPGAAGGAGGRLLPLPLPLPAGADQSTSPHPAAVPHGAHAPAWPPPSSAAAHNYYHPYARQSTDTYGGFGNEYAGAATAAAAAAAGGMGGAPRISNGAGSGQGSGGGGLDDLWGMCDDQMMSHVLDMFDNNEFPPHASHLTHPAQHNPCGTGNTGGGGLPQLQSAPHMPQPHSSRLPAAGAVGSGAAAAGTAPAGAWQAAGLAGMWPAALAPGGGGLPYYCTTADATSSGGAPAHHAPH